VSVVAKAIAEGGESAINFEVKKIQADAIKVLGSQNNTKLILLPSDILESLSSVTSRLMSKL
jgi:hypothetical protein